MSATTQLYLAKQRFEDPVNDLSATAPSRLHQRQLSGGRAGGGGVAAPSHVATIAASASTRGGAVESSMAVSDWSLLSDAKQRMEVYLRLGDRDDDSRVPIGSTAARHPAPTHGSPAVAHVGNVTSNNASAILGVSQSTVANQSAGSNGASRHAAGNSEHARTGTTTECLPMMNQSSSRDVAEEPLAQQLSTTVTTTGGGWSAILASSPDDWKRRPRDREEAQDDGRRAMASVQGQPLLERAAVVGQLPSCGVASNNTVATCAPRNDIVCGERKVGGSRTRGGAENDAAPALGDAPAVPLPSTQGILKTTARGVRSSSQQPKQTPGGPPSSSAKVTYTGLAGDDRMVEPVGSVAATALRHGFSAGAEPLPSVAMETLISAKAAFFGSNNVSKATSDQAGRGVDNDDDDDDLYVVGAMGRQDDGPGGALNPLTDAEIIEDRFRRRQQRLFQTTLTGLSFHDAALLTTTRRKRKEVAFLTWRLLLCIPEAETFFGDLFFGPLPAEIPEDVYDALHDESGDLVVYADPMDSLLLQPGGGRDGLLGEPHDASVMSQAGGGLPNEGFGDDNDVALSKWLPTLPPPPTDLWRIARDEAQVLRDADHIRDEVHHVDRLVDHVALLNQANVEQQVKRAAVAESAPHAGASVDAAEEAASPPRHVVADSAASPNFSSSPSGSGESQRRELVAPWSPARSRAGGASAASPGRRRTVAAADPLSRRKNATMTLPSNVRDTLDTLQAQIMLGYLLQACDHLEMERDASTKRDAAVNCTPMSDAIASGHNLSSSSSSRLNGALGSADRRSDRSSLLLAPVDGMNRPVAASVNRNGATSHRRSYSASASSTTAGGGGGAHHLLGQGSSVDQQRSPPLLYGAHATAASATAAGSPTSTASQGAVPLAPGGGGGSGGGGGAVLRPPSALAIPNYSLAPGGNMPPQSALGNSTTSNPRSTVARRASVVAPAKPQGGRNPFEEASGDSGDEEGRGYGFSTRGNVTFGHEASTSGPHDASATTAAPADGADPLDNLSSGIVSAPPSPRRVRRDSAKRNLEASEAASSKRRSKDARKRKKKNKKKSGGLFSCLRPPPSSDDDDDDDDDGGDDSAIDLSTSMSDGGPRA